MAEVAFLSPDSYLRHTKFLAPECIYFLTKILILKMFFLFKMLHVQNRFLFQNMFHSFFIGICYQEIYRLFSILDYIEKGLCTLSEKYIECKVVSYKIY